MVVTLSNLGGGWLSWAEPRVREEVKLLVDGLSTVVLAG